MRWHLEQEEREEGKMGLLHGHVCVFKTNIFRGSDFFFYIVFFRIMSHGHLELQSGWEEFLSFLRLSALGAGSGYGIDT